MEYLKHYIPSKSIDKISEWLEEYNCTLTIKKRRTTKLGDYRYHKNKHYISINEDLNPYSFLITLTHEIAHMVVTEKYSSRVSPHGKEWKNEFKKLMLGFIPLFPIEIQQSLAIHLKNPKASSSSDYMLVKALRKYDSQPTLTVSDIPNGSIFFTPNGKKYLKEKKIKTRFQCKSLNNNKIYLFNPLAEVRI
jgi:hypothetical protein